MIPFTMSNVRNVRKPSVSMNNSAYTDKNCLCAKIRSECEARSSIFHEKAIPS